MIHEEFVDTLDAINNITLEKFIVVFELDHLSLKIQEFNYAKFKKDPIVYTVGNLTSKGYNKLQD